MGNMRTLAFQILEELFQKIKDYLQRNNMSQKEFVIGLIENEIESNLSQKASTGNVSIDIDDAKTANNSRKLTLWVNPRMALRKTKRLMRIIANRRISSPL